MQSIIPRKLAYHLRELGKYFPILSLTGPRQAGKTTLLRELYPDYQYLSLEDPDFRDRANADPRGFLEQYSERVIFDEAQRVPELFSYLQTAVDANRTPGRYILSGSQNFLLRQNITQSLAGRVGITQLLPLDLGEIQAAGLLKSTFAETMLAGCYPEHYDKGIPPNYFFPSYVASYLERDISGLISASNLEAFRQFLRICATYAGQTLHYSAIGKATGISQATVKSWLSVLEQSYIIFKLPPYFRNFGKRIIKSPKLYFYDTGLLCYLLRITNVTELRDNYHFGALFENFIIADHFKRSWHRGEEPRFYFYRDSNRVEVDLLEERANRYLLTEIKAGKTFSPQQVKNLEHIAAITDRPADKRLIYGGQDAFTYQDVDVRPWNETGSDK